MLNITKFGINVNRIGKRSKVIFTLIRDALQNPFRSLLRDRGKDKPDPLVAAEFDLASGLTADGYGKLSETLVTAAPSLQQTGETSVSWKRWAESCWMTFHLTIGLETFLMKNNDPGAEYQSDPDGNQNKNNLLAWGWSHRTSFLLLEVKSFQIEKKDLKSLLAGTCSMVIDRPLAQNVLLETPIVDQ